MVDNPKNCVYTPPVATLQGERQTKSRAVAQSGSALAWGARGRGFESRLPDKQERRSPSAAFFFCFYPATVFYPHHDTCKGEWAASAGGTSRPCAGQTPLPGYPANGGAQGAGRIPLARRQINQQRAAVLRLPLFAFQHFMHQIGTSCDI